MWASHTLTTCGITDCIASFYNKTKHIIVSQWPTIHRRMLMLSTLHEVLIHWNMPNSPVSLHLGSWMVYSPFNSSDPSSRHSSIRVSRVTSILYNHLELGLKLSSLQASLIDTFKSRRRQMILSPSLYLLYLGMCLMDFLSPLLMASTSLNTST